MSSILYLGNPSASSPAEETGGVVAAPVRSVVSSIVRNVVMTLVCALMIRNPFQ